MSLKSIRESYSKFIATLQGAGVKLTESQKANIDGFILAIESKMAKQKQLAIKATKKVVTEHLEKEYKKVFESILKHQEQNQELASKVQNKIASINESKKIARKVNDYLDLYVESVLPKKTIVDYDRMHKLEKLHESLKDLLVVNEDSVEAKKKALSESFDKAKRDYETKIARLQVKLNESIDKSLKLNRKIDSFKAAELLESMSKDLPSYEARQLKKRFENASTVEIQKNFKRVLESVKEEMKVDEKEEEASLEEEVKDIIESEEEVKENDILKGRHHNGHLPESEEDLDEAEDEVTEADEEIDESDDESINESIDPKLMELWTKQFNKIIY